MWCNVRRVQDALALCYVGTLRDPHVDERKLAWLILARTIVQDFKCGSGGHIVSFVCRHL